MISCQINTLVLKSISRNWTISATKRRIPRLGSKFCGLRKTVVPKYIDEYKYDESSPLYDYTGITSTVFLLFACYAQSVCIVGEAIEMNVLYYVVA